MSGRVFLDTHCPILLSEDLSEGQTYGLVTVRNPFRLFRQDMIRKCAHLFGVGIGIGIGVDPDTDSDSDPDSVAGNGPP